MTVDDSYLGALGLTLKNCVVGAAASFIALRFFEGLGVWEKWTTFLGGWALAAWGGPSIAAYLEVKTSIEVGVVLITGLFGMAVSAEAVRLIRDTDWRGLLDSILRRKSS
jgi:hypothetical protein